MPYIPQQGIIVVKHIKKNSTISRNRKMLIIMIVISFILLITGIILFIIAYKSLCVKKEKFRSRGGVRVGGSGSGKKCIERISIDDASTETKLMYYLGIVFMAQFLLVIIYRILLWSKNLI